MKGMKKMNTFCFVVIYLNIKYKIFEECQNLSFKPKIKNSSSKDVRPGWLRLKTSQRRDGEC